MNKQTEFTLPEHRLLLGDCLEKLSEVEDESVQLTVTSPPYNIGKEYEKNARMQFDEYLDWLDEVISALVKKTNSSGSICWQVGNHVRSGEVFPLDVFCYKLFAKHGLKLRNRIIWQFNFGLHAQRRFSGRYETVLWFSKSDDYKFNLDPVRVPQIYPGKRHSKKKGEMAGKPSGNKLGKNPSDYWEFDAKEQFIDNPVWFFPNVKSNHTEKTAHPCQFPIELAERCVLALSDEDDLILDPFVGAGTTMLAAMRNNRSAVGIDLMPEYIEISQQRLKELAADELKYRPLGKTVYSPNARERIAKVPKEWID